VARRELDADTVEALLASEIESREGAALDYERHGRGDEAERRDRADRPLSRLNRLARVVGEDAVRQPLPEPCESPGGGIVSAPQGRGERRLPCAKFRRGLRAPPRARLGPLAAGRDGR